MNLMAGTDDSQRYRSNRLRLYTAAAATMEMTVHPAQISRSWVISFVAPVHNIA
ncbi:hypothetical protein JNUCC32_23210 [Paenibacillus sp. JNUCC32]|nr:hypothetical protein JNUCC32_23210 [Paenibacillus sp. JNUCC-32]